MAILDITTNRGKFTVDTNRAFGGFESGDIICSCCPFFDIPLQLELAIRLSGDIIFRAWTWDTPNNAGVYNTYLHVSDVDLYFIQEISDHKPTQSQRDTIIGLWSGRLLWEGLKLGVGATLMRAAGIDDTDISAEEDRLGRQIMLA